jgi:NAD(P)H-dependent FMN reductase
MPQKTKLGLIYGSAREGRFCDTMVNWAAAEIVNDGRFAASHIDPRDLDKSRAEIGHRLDEADAFLIVTPEYNHGYTGALKSLIDAYNQQWQIKPIAFVSYGGVSGGLRAVEQLRLVFAELHAVGIRDTVSFANPWNRFDSTGALVEPKDAQRAMKTLLARLHWWAVTLRDARATSSYFEVAA